MRLLSQEPYLRSWAPVLYMGRWRARGQLCCGQRVGVAWGGSPLGPIHTLLEGGEWTCRGCPRALPAPSPALAWPTFLLSPFPSPRSVV